MRWKQQDGNFGSPSIGHIKVKTMFLWWPMCLNKEYRWLEFANVEMVYVHGDRSTEGPHYSPCRFVDRSYHVSQH